MPGRLEPAGRPELHHIADVDEDHVLESGRGGPFLVGGRGGGGVIGGPDLQAADVVLEEKRDAAPVRVGAYAVLRGGGGGQGGVVHQLEVVEVGFIAVVLGREGRGRELKAEGDAFEEREREGVEFGLEGADHSPVRGEDGWEGRGLGGGEGGPFADAEGFARVGFFGVSGGGVRVRGLEASVVGGVVGGTEFDVVGQGEEVLLEGEDGAHVLEGDWVVLHVEEACCG